MVLSCTKLHQTRHLNSLKIARGTASPGREPAVWFVEDFWKTLQTLGLVTRHCCGSSLKNCQLWQQCRSLYLWCICGNGFLFIFCSLLQPPDLNMHRERCKLVAITTHVLSHDLSNLLRAFTILYKLVVV